MMSFGKKPIRYLWNIWNFQSKLNFTPFILCDIGISKINNKQILWNYLIKKGATKRGKLMCIDDERQ